MLGFGGVEIAGTVAATELAGDDAGGAVTGTAPTA
jgi:hypothetical protein